MRTALGGVFLLALGASVAPAQTPIPLTIYGNEARGTIELPDSIEAELTIAFENVVGLTPAALDASATLVDPEDPTVLDRLPAEVSIPEAFPVLVRISPSASSTLSFSGVAKVSLYTHNLVLDRAMPLALNKSPDSGAFRDITISEGMGSYRVSGSTGEFSEFLIVVDGRQIDGQQIERRPMAGRQIEGLRIQIRSIDTIIVEKFDYLQALLTESAGSIPSTLVNILQGILSQARTLYQLGMTVAAIGQVTSFSNLVKAQSGLVIPDVWRANDPTAVNVAGRLRSAADTLKFSLARKANR